MNLFEESIRMKTLMKINEQSSEDDYMKEFAMGKFDKLKELLLNNSEITDKLKSLFKTTTVEETESSLLKPNKTILMRGMADSKVQKDMTLYKFLEIFLKNVDSMS